MRWLNRSSSPHSPAARAWMFYDWANSSYALVINTAIFPLYFQAVMHNQPDAVRLFGFTINANAAYSYALSLSFLILVVLSPILSSIAAARGNKLTFLKAFCWMGALACMGLSLFRSPADIGLALVLNIIASIGFYGSLVFYNAYLPEVAPPEAQDQVSAQGFAMGYVGSLIMLAICLVLIQVVATPESVNGYTRLCFFLTGCWWLGFAQRSFARLPRGIANQVEPGASVLAQSWHTLKSTLATVAKMPRMTWFLSAFFLYSVGMQTIFLIATFIGTEIHLPTALMIMTIMLLQVEAIAGALLFARWTRTRPTTVVMLVAVAIWVVVCVLIYRLGGALESPRTWFFITAGLVGLVMGGLQSLSRSSLSKLIPEAQDAAPYFSVYDIVEKAAIVSGTAIHGTLMNQTGSTHASALALACFFVAGGVCLWRLRRQERIDESRSPLPND